MIHAARRVAAAVVLAVLAGAAPARTPSAEALRDAEFGVAAPGAIGLERRVEMYRPLGGDEGAAGWSGEPDADMPLDSRRWIPARVTLDGHPVDPAAVEALARWEPLRPDFSALPGNLSATFQPEGDGLGSAANPVHPEPGDLRITWHALRMPGTRAPLVLRDGRWTLRDPGAAQAAAAGPGEPPARGTWAWTVLGMFAGALFAGVLLLLRRRR